MATSKKVINCLIKIAPDSGDKATTKFASINGKAFSIPVGVETEVPYVLYEKVLLKGNLKNRVSLIRVL